MKQFFSMLIFGLLVIPLTAKAQAPDTVYIPNDYVAGTINNVIQGDTTESGARVNPNRVYMLYRGGYYILNGNLTVNPGVHITIVGEEHNVPNTGADSGMAIIIPGPVTGGYYNYNIDCFGDLTMKNVWLFYGYTDGTQDWTALQFEQNENAEAFGNFDNCIFEDVRAIAVMSNRTGAVFHFTNCIFRNCIDPSQWWAGRQVATYSASASMDTCTSVNCTFENMGFGFQADYTPPKVVFYNHNTFLNIAKFTFKFYYMTNLICTNNIFVNNHFTGERYADRSGQDPDNLLYGAVLDIDTIPSGLNYNGVSELNRVVIFYNNSNYTQPDFQTFYNTYNDTTTTLRGKILAEPMMNDRTLEMFTWHPLMKMANVYDGSDPNFVTPATDMDSIMAFLQARYVTGGNVFWGYKEDLGATWPLPENLAYTNDTLLTAAMGGFPLGDLYHWFPDKYVQWKGQESAETAGILALTAVKERPGNLPVKFTLDQNYPNPFNPTTVINYSLPKNGFVTLKVYNVLGQEVANLFSGVQRAGNYQATFDGGKLASGVYIYRLQSGNVSVTKKMILMK